MGLVKDRIWVLGIVRVRDIVSLDLGKGYQISCHLPFVATFIKVGNQSVTCIKPVYVEPRTLLDNKLE